MPLYFAFPGGDHSAVTGTLPFTTVPPTLLATSLVFSPASLSTSYVESMETTTVPVMMSTTSATPSSTTTASPTTTPGLPVSSTTTALPVPTEPPEPPCCERANGLCEWIEPECEALSEEDRKRFIWDDEYCDEVHPDDMEEIQERLQMYKDMLKRQKFARVWV